MKHRIFKTIVWIAVILVIITFAGSYFIGLQVVSNSTQLTNPEDTKDVQIEYWKENNFNIDDFNAQYKIENISIKSSLDGYIIPADLIYKEPKKKETIIMVHGLGGNRYTNYPVAEYFLERGYNVLTYDQRSSNENIAKHTTFGYLEKFDTIDCINYMQDSIKDGKVSIWGQSFGGATAIQAAAYKEVQNNLEFIILDCPITDMKWMLKAEMSEMNIGIPVDYMLWWGNVANKIKLGFSYNDADMVRLSKNINIPVLIINSSIDETTPEFMGKEIYDNINTENKIIWTVNDSKHAEVWKDHNKEYIEKLNEFIHK